MSRGTSTSWLVVNFCGLTLNCHPGEAKDLLSRALPRKRVLRFAQDDNWDYAPNLRDTLRLRVERPLEEVSRARMSQKLIRFYYHAAARQHSVGHARNLNSLEH